MKYIPSIKIISILVIIALAVTLVLQNRAVVETKILFATVSMPRAMLLGTVFILGAFSGLLIALVIARRNQASKKQ